jgi:hypothetical protein
VVPYGCETWSLTFKKEHKLWVFENRVLRRIFGLMRDEMTGEWRKLHNEELRDLYSSPSTVKLQNTNKAETCSIRTNYIVPARRIDITVLKYTCIS